MMMDASGGSGSDYIVRYDELQPSDQTDLNQGSKYDVEVGWIASREGEDGWPLGQASRPPLVASRSPPRSRAFSCLLESSGVSFHRDQVSWCFINLILIFVLSE
jgi:hypothetical protein